MEDKTFPKILQIEPTTKCNLDCVLCGRKILSKKLNQDIEMIKFKKIVDDFPQSKEILLSDFGEPLLTDRIFEMISYAKRRGKRVMIITNGVFLDKFSKRIIESGLDEILLSFDTTDSNLFEKLRGLDVNKIVGNVNLLNKLKSEMKSETPKITFNTVLIKDNVKNLKEIVGLAKRLGIKSINLNSLVIWSEKQKEFSLTEDVIYTYLESFSKVAAKSGISYSFFPAYESKEFIIKLKSLGFFMPEHSHCRNSILVRVDGSIFPCFRVENVSKNFLETRKYLEEIDFECPRCKLKMDE